MKKNMDDDVLKYGCTLSIKAPRCLHNVNIFGIEYHKLIRKPLIAIIVFFISFVSVFISVLISNVDNHLVSASFLMLLYFFLFSLPFILRIKSIVRCYKLTRSLFMQLKTDDDLILDLEEFEIKLHKKNEILREIYYFDLINIELYDYVVVFRCRNAKNNFFISSKYKNQLMNILNKMELSMLVKEK